MELNKFLEKNIEYSKEYHSNQIIFNQLEECNSIGIVLNGQVKILSYTLDGKEVEFNLLNKGKIFGSSLIFATSSFYKGTIIALKPSKIGFISKDKLNIILKDEHINHLFLNYLSDEILKSKEKTRLLSFASSKDKLLYYLYLHEEISYESITKLASYLAITRESLSRTISLLVKEKKIIKENKILKLKKD